MILSLSIIQGVALNHQRSKRWLGRTKSLEVKGPLPLDCIEKCSSKQSGTFSNLTSTILDTMLCILVDSTPALRAFEQCNGFQAIVKILKRAGSPREVRMKCLEFLYFYLLDETKPSTATTSSAESTFVDLIPTVPNTPSQSRTSNSSYGSRSSIFPPTVPNTPHESAHSRQSSQSILRGVSNSSISSASSVSSAGSNSQHSVPRGQTKKPYLNGLAAPNRPSPKARSEYGSSTFSFPHSSYSGPSVKSDASEKGYVMESSPSSRSNSDSGKAGIGRQVVTEGEANTFRLVSSGSAKSFTSTSSTTSAASVSTTSSTSTAPGSTECSPKKSSSTLPSLPTIPSGTVFKTPSGSPEMGFAAPPGLNSRLGRESRTPSTPRTPAVKVSSSKAPLGPFRTLCRWCRRLRVAIVMGEVSNHSIGFGLYQMCFIPCCFAQSFQRWLSNSPPPRMPVAVR
ncbi:cell division control protein 14, SIN component-domain-containing protein [Lentinula boryana]|uniref:Cell division control protein 14, SIN component-domain-containing protein n=1 Tax=Lentinula boryana TaxID=40481 RepID=A0ABQ8QHR4_9AGAR|nr:cell division control protein 14, SIN component-domain-containing protein [Lentinula boryana]